MSFEKQMFMIAKIPIWTTIWKMKFKTFKRHNQAMEEA